mmetsp:Transcript_75906/g.180404  ORF Transcript_75906/g.180404 Transcript_75906/m.180404 type:complete len:204 (+) Transcript_75906:1060-1671(+)
MRRMRAARLPLLRPDDSGRRRWCPCATRRPQASRVILAPCVVPNSSAPAIQHLEDAERVVSGGATLRAGPHCCGRDPSPGKTEPRALLAAPAPHRSASFLSPAPCSFSRVSPLHPVIGHHLHQSLHLRTSAATPEGSHAVAKPAPITLSRDLADHDGDDAREEVCDARTLGCLAPQSRASAASHRQNCKRQALIPSQRSGLPS